MRLRISLAAALLFASVPAIAAVATTPSQSVIVTSGSFVADRVWWARLNHSQKVVAVQSMMASESFMYGLTTALVVADLMSMNQGDAIKAVTKRDVSFGKSAELYVSKIDRYYATHPHSSSEVPLVLACFADSPFPKEGCTAARNPRR